MARNRRPDLGPERPFTAAEIAAAKAVPIENLVARQYTVIGSPNTPYLRTKEHDSLVLCRTFNTYHWNSKGNDHGDTIDWVMKHGSPGLSWRSAVATLLAYPATWRAAPPEPATPRQGPGGTPTRPMLPPYLAEKYHAQLTPEGYRWWARRGISRALVDHLLLGEDEASYTIPVWDVDDPSLLRNVRHRSKVKDAVTRYLPERPGLGTQVYVPHPNLLQHRELVWTSGEIKAIVLAALGRVYAATSTNGCLAWLPEWGRHLASKRVTVAFDPGEEEQAEHIAGLIRRDAPDAEVWVAHLPGDPDDLLTAGDFSAQDMQRFLFPTGWER